MGFPDRIATERLTLRPWEADGYEHVLSVWADPGVWSSLRGDGVPFSEDRVRERFEHHVAHWHEYGFGLYGLSDRAHGETAGWVGPSHPDFVEGLEEEIEIGWALRGAFQGRGYATEGARAVIPAVFDHLGPERVISLIVPENARSIAVAKRLGMRHTGDALHAESGQLHHVYELRKAA